MLDDQFKQQERLKDRVNQAEVLRRLCAFKGPLWAFEQTNTGSVFDAFVLHRGERAALVEVKCRTCTFAAFESEGYRIDRHKLQNLVRSGTTYNVPAILAVRWKCGTHGYINLSMASMWESFPSKLVKRGDRDELADLQSDIPMKLFTKF